MPFYAHFQGVAPEKVLLAHLNAHIHEEGLVPALPCFQVGESFLCFYFCASCGSIKSELENCPNCFQYRNLAEMPRRYKLRRKSPHVSTSCSAESLDLGRAKIDGQAKEGEKCTNFAEMTPHLQRKPPYYAENCDKSGTNSGKAAETLSCPPKSVGTTTKDLSHKTSKKKSPVAGKAKLKPQKANKRGGKRDGKQLRTAPTGDVPQA